MTHNTSSLVDVFCEICQYDILVAFTFFFLFLSGERKIIFIHTHSSLYCKLAGKSGAKLRRVLTPFIEESGYDSTIKKGETSNDEPSDYENMSAANAIAHKVNKQKN